MPIRITMHRKDDSPLECVCLGDLAEAIAAARDAKQTDDCFAVQIWNADGQLLHEDGEPG